MDVTVLIPTHVQRMDNGMLTRALKSVSVQTVKPREVLVVVDTFREGSAATRNRGLQSVSTEWVAFLDSDDEFLPYHLEQYDVSIALDDRVDVVYTGCVVRNQVGDNVPLREEWGRYGQPFDADVLRQMSYIPVTSIVRTGLAQMAGFSRPEGSLYDDWGFYLNLLNLDARFRHVSAITWVWHHHGMNTSGSPYNGDAAGG
jgi:glycosyltransferase involved in cell wall biosynthesis